MYRCAFIAVLVLFAVTSGHNGVPGVPKTKDDKKKFADYDNWCYIVNKKTDGTEFYKWYSVGKSFNRCNYISVFTALLCFKISSRFYFCTK
jgi:hypothetical protein